MYKTMMQLTGALIFAIGLASTVANAQQMDKQYDFAPAFKYGGAEISSGTDDGYNVWGETLVMNNNDGEWEAGHLTVSLNYRPGEKRYFDIFGGTWSLVVYRNNEYAGTLYGILEAGERFSKVSSDGNESIWIRMKLCSTGGSGIYQESLNKCNVRFAFEAVVDGKSREVTGTLDMEL